MSEETEFLWNEYSSLKDWIILSDTKAGAIIAFYGLLGALFFPNIVSIFNSIKEVELLRDLFALIGMMVAISLICAIWSIFPDIQVKQPPSLLYYSTIRKKYPTAKSYIKAVNVEFKYKDKLQNDLIGQVWALAHVADRKFTLVRTSYVFLLFAILIGIVGALYKLFN